MRRARQLTGPNRNCKNNTACVTQTLKTSSSTRASFIRIIKLTNFFFKTSKKSIFEGTGGSAENGSKTWSKCHFLLLYRRKSGQKVVKKCSNPGGQAGPTNRSTEPTFCKFFVLLIKIYSVVKISLVATFGIILWGANFKSLNLTYSTSWILGPQVRPRGLSHCKCGTHSRSANNTSSLLTFFQMFKNSSFDAETLFVVFIETAMEPGNKVWGEQARDTFLAYSILHSILGERLAISSFAFS